MDPNAWQIALLSSDEMPMWNGLSEEWCKLSDKIMWPNIRHNVPVSLLSPLVGLIKKKTKDFMACVPCRAVTAAVPATTLATSMKVMRNTTVQQPQ